MHEARAGIGGDEAAGQQAHVEVVALAAQRMGSEQAVEILGRDIAQHLGRELRRLGDGADQLLGQHHLLARLGAAALAHLGDLDQRVGDVGPEGERAIARDGPGRRGPDHHRGAVELAALGLHHREADMDGVRRMVVILDLGFGERGLLDHAPQHGLGALVEAAVHQELAELVRDHGLGLVGHGRIVIVPVALDAQPLELLALHLDPVIGEGAALAAELADRHRILVLVLGAVLLLDLPFDRQAMAVPARHVVAVLAQHLLGARDEVLQDLVERVADMEVAVGVGRAVMQDELGPAAALGAQAMEQVHVGPALQELGLLLRETGAHGEVGLGQEDAGFVISCHEKLGAGRSDRRLPQGQPGTGITTRPRSADRADNSLRKDPERHGAGNLWAGVRGVKAAPLQSLHAESGLSGIPGISGRDRGVWRPKHAPMASGAKPRVFHVPSHNRIITTVINICKPILTAAGRPPDNWRTAGHQGRRFLPLLADFGPPANTQPEENAHVLLDAIAHADGA